MLIRITEKKDGYEISKHYRAYTQPSNLNPNPTTAYTIVSLSNCWYCECLFDLENILYGFTWSNFSALCFAFMQNVSSCRYLCGGFGRDNTYITFSGLWQFKEITVHSGDDDDGGGDGAVHWRYTSEHFVLSMVLMHILYWLCHSWFPSTSDTHTHTYIYFQYTPPHSTQRPSKNIK